MIEATGRDLKSPSYLRNQPTELYNWGKGGEDNHSIGDFQSDSTQSNHSIEESLNQATCWLKKSQNMSKKISNHQNM